MNTRKLRKSIVQLNNELLNNALSFKPILLVPKAIIYHQGFPFPRLKSRNQKKKEKKKTNKNHPNPPLLKDCFLSTVGRWVQKETGLVCCSTNQYL